MPLRNALRLRPQTLQASCVPSRWPAAVPGAAVGASDGSLRPPPENHKNLEQKSPASAHLSAIALQPLLKKYDAKMQKDDGSPSRVGQGYRG